MNFLQLCVELQRECDVPGAQMTAVTDQVKELDRLVNWIKQSWNELQGRSTRWRWMRSTFSLTTTLGVDSYAATSATDTRIGGAISRFARWWPMDERGAANVKIYLQSAGVGTERWMSYMSWADFREIYKRGTVNNAPPAHFTIDPQNKLVFGPPPDGVYIATGEYQMSQQELSTEADTPEMPTRFHPVIVYMAMRKYAGFEGAPEVMSRGVVEGNRVLRQLELDQLPVVALGPPMA